MSEKGTVAVWVELSGENLPLAERELQACASVLDPASSPPRPLPWGGERFREVTFSRPGPEGLLARRLGLAHRVLRPLAEGNLDTLVDAMVMEGGSGATARVRVASGAPQSLAREAPRLLGHAFLQGGGRVDLGSPDRDFVVLLPAASASPPAATEAGLAELLGEVPRDEMDSRRSKHRPFRKPVTLSPLLARSLVNLAGAPLGGSILDPFCGTGAILLEAAFLGYRVSGADRDAEMIRGTLQNLRAEKVEPDRLVQCEVQELLSQLEGERFDAAVFAPPYGRASGTGGRASSEVLLQAVEALPGLLRPHGRATCLVSDPSSLPPMPRGLTLESTILGERVHRSLTRWVVTIRRDH